MQDYLYNVCFFYLYSSKGGFQDTNPCYIPLSEINTAELGCRLVVLETNIKNSNFLMINSHPSRGVGYNCPHCELLNNKTGCPQVNAP